MNGNVITANFRGGRTTRTAPLWQYDYGQVLRFTGVSLPETYEVHFSNAKRRGDAKTAIGDANGVVIPDEFLATGDNVYAWIFLHATQEDGETEYMATIPVNKRATPSDEAPTPQEQSAITQAIAALNSAVVDVQEAVEAADDARASAASAGASASAAAASEAGVAEDADRASAAATAAAGAQTAAEAAQAGAETAQTGAESARDEAAQASAAQIAQINATGAAVLESIPADYTELSEDVDNLKSDVNTVTTELFTVSDNLFDFGSIIENAVPGSIGSSPDTTITLNGWKTSNYIPVEAGQRYALILNSSISAGAVFRVACYANGVETYKSSAQESNPYIIPDGVDHIRFFSNTASLFATRTATSFKKYTADLNLAWTPYGLIDNFASKAAVQEYGVYVDGTNYYHFVRFGEQTLIRLFKQEGPNNLFQFSALYTGNVTKEGVNIDQTIATNGTDTVGPISIMRQGIDTGGMWSGGWHTRTVNGVTCPTAEQQNLDIKINGESIVGVDGLHYGECVATVVSKLYFPQTITGTDLSTATQAIQETVTYILNEKMTARVAHKYVADTRVILYYGMQAVRIGFDDILLPNNETAFAFADMPENIKLDKPEDLMQMSNNKWNYDLIMKPFGLAKYTHNSGAGSTKYGFLPVSTRKVYWALMEGAYDYTFITNGKVLAWEGVWDIYPN